MKNKKRCHCVTADQSEISYSVNPTMLYGNGTNNITRLPLYSGANLDGNVFYRVLLHADGTATFNFNQRSIDGEYKPTTGNKYFSLVRSTDDLATGDSVIIVDGTNNYAIGNNLINGKYNLAAVNLQSDGLLQTNADALVFAIRKNKTSWALKTGNTYLAIGRDGLTNASSLTNGRFDLTLSDGEAAISFNANYDNNRLNFDLDNYTSNVVSSAPTGLRIYKLDTAAGIAGTQATPTEKGVREVYNLQGQRVNANSKLPKGIYIINGKKTVVR